MDTKQLKEGDRVAWRNRNNDQWSVVTVDRVTQTQLITSDKMRWSRKTGKAIGWSVRFTCPRLQEATEERVRTAEETVERREIETRLSRHSWSDDDLETLRRVDQALVPPDPEPEPEAPGELRTWSCHGRVVGGKYLGTVEARSKEEAESLAYGLDEASVSLCHHCSEQCEDPEIDEVICEVVE